MRIHFGRSNHGRTFCQRFDFPGKHPLPWPMLCCAPATFEKAHQRFLWWLNERRNFCIGIGDACGLQEHLLWQSCFQGRKPPSRRTRCSASRSLVVDALSMPKISSKVGQGVVVINASEIPTVIAPMIRSVRLDMHDSIKLVRVADELHVRLAGNERGYDFGRPFPRKPLRDPVLDVGRVRINCFISDWSVK